MARLTKAQREWRPGMPKPRRSTKVTLASTVLSLEAFVAFFATLVIFGLRAREFSAPVVLISGFTLAVVLMIACAFLRRPWGYWFGWALQIVLILVGIFEPAMYVIGLLFAGCWWYALRTGARIDRENVQRDDEQRQWDLEHPDETQG